MHFIIHAVLDSVDGREVCRKHVEREILKHFNCDGVICLYFCGFNVVFAPFNCHYFILHSIIYTRPASCLYFPDHLKCSAVAFILASVCYIVF